MQKRIIVVGGVVLGLLVLAFGAVQLFPGPTLSALQAAVAWKGGYDSQKIDVGGYTTHYYAAGPEDAPVVVLLHGLIDDKNSFVPAAEPLTENYRVILPDLQGHGENAQEAGRDYSIHGQVTFLADFLEALGVNELRLGGNSMGGHIAASFALAHEERVQKLMLLNATGMLLDQPPTYVAYPDIIDVAYVTEMYDRVFINPPRIPGPIMRYLAHDLNSKTPFYNALIDAVITGEDFRLDDRVRALDIPTLIIWGTDDRLVPLHYGEAYDAALPNSQLVVFEAGHAPQLEVPQAVGPALAAFVESN